MKSFDSNKKTIAVEQFSVCCKLNELESVIESIEKKDGFYKWGKPPLEQLDEVIGKMTDLNKDTIPPTTIFYMLLVDKATWQPEVGHFFRCEIYE